jgi:hypothetical protein
LSENEIWGEPPVFWGELKHEKQLPCRKAEEPEK